MSGDVDFVTGAPVPGDLDVHWIHGSPSRRRNADPAIQVHHYDEHTVVLRQNKAVHYEAPFLFLLFGNERALLMDTGATADPARFPLRDTVDALVGDWLAAHPREGYGLVVAHTHAHGDHVAGDPQFAGRPGAIVVGTDLSAVRSFFGLGERPHETVPFDLGGRVLEVTGIPGHHRTSIAVHDPWTGLLLTGDTVCRGRLYVEDYPAFTASLDRLVDIARDRRVTHVLGCHIEMTRAPGRDYPIGATHQPDEPPLQLTVEQLVAARDAAARVAGRPGVHPFDDVVVVYRPGRRDRLRYTLRYAAGAARNTVAPVRGIGR